MNKVLTVIGARPQFIKAAAVSRVLREKKINEVILHTGQHFDYNMSKIFFEEMQIPEPDYNLNISNLSHGAMTGRMIEGIEKIIIKENPDVVLVYGDTNSTFAGALSAKKLNIKVAHIEAGLRSFNMMMPEEINRILTDRISNYLFCPTDVAVDNLNKEGFHNFECIIEKSGDVMYDAALFYEKFSAEKSHIISSLNLKKQEFILGTIHRQENTDNQNNLVEILSAFEELNKSIKVVLPLHPRTRRIINEQNIKANFTIIDPVGYFDMIELLKNCKLVITDSGGLQKEAFFFKKFCITTRNETEWTELVDNHFNFVVGADMERILQETQAISRRKENFNINLYGEGEASERIVKSLFAI